MRAENDKMETYDSNTVTIGIKPRPLTPEGLINESNRAYDIGRRHGKEEMKIEMINKMYFLIEQLKEQLT